MSARVLIISPVRNEVEHLERTAAALVGQTRPPDRWVVVDDGSDDGTLELLRKLEREIPFMRVLTSPPGDAAVDVDRLAVARDARAFNFALSHEAAACFTHVGKLDGDIELPPEYFAEILAEFDSEPRLGIAGGALIEPFGPGWRRLNPPPYHVHGAVKLYSVECLEAIGGMHERLGWDTIDETYARLRGYVTRSVSRVRARHHRPSASAQGRLRGYARWGRCAYVVRYPALWVTVRALKEATKSPVVLTGAAFLYGYWAAVLRREPRVEDEAFRRHVRAEMYSRMLRPVRAGKRIAGTAG